MEPIYIEIDTDGTLHRSTVAQFLADNTHEGECLIDTSEVIELHNLKVGQTMKVTGYVGCFVTVRRISHDMQPVRDLSGLTHFSRDGKTCLCGKPVCVYRGPSNLQVSSFYGKAHSTPSCRTCREAMTVEDYHVKPEPVAHKGFDEIRVCPHCGSPAEEKFSGDEGWTFCSDGCGCLEGESGPLPRKFECLECHEICDEEKCACGNHEPEPATV